MWNEPTPEQLAKLPKLYETEKVPLRDKPIYIHFFRGSCDWFMTEYDREDLFFGYAIVGNPAFAEWDTSLLPSLMASGFHPASRSIVSSSTYRLGRQGSRR